MMERAGEWVNRSSFSEGEKIARHRRHTQLDGERALKRAGRKTSNTYADKKVSVVGPALCVNIASEIDTFSR